MLILAFRMYHKVVPVYNLKSFENISLRTVLSLLRADILARRFERARALKVLMYVATLSSFLLSVIYEVSVSFQRVAWQLCMHAECVENIQQGGGTQSY